MNGYLAPLVDELKQLWQGVINAVSFKHTMQHLFVQLVTYLLPGKSLVFYDIMHCVDVHDV